MASIESDITERFLKRAGLAPGVHALDVGCGDGTVTFHMADVVGSTGSVTGIDSNEKAVDSLRQKAADAGISNVRFVVGNLIPDDIRSGGFDLAFTRRVVMHQPDPVTSVSRIASAVRPGGTLALQENNSSDGLNLRTAMPLHADIHDKIWRWMENKGGSSDLGFRLFDVLARAGLSEIDLRAEAMLLTPNSDCGVPRILRSMAPMLIRTGAFDEADLDVEDLVQRLEEERKNSATAAIWDFAFLGLAKRS